MPLKQVDTYSDLPTSTLFVELSFKVLTIGSRAFPAAPAAVRKQNLTTSFQYQSSTRSGIS